MEKNRKKGSGGARPGAGRNWGEHYEKKVQVSFTLKKEIVDFIASQAEELGESKSKTLEVIISNYVQDADGKKIEIY